MRSVIVASTLDQQARAVDAYRMAGQGRQLGGEAIGDRLHVGRLPLRLDLTAVEPVEVQEVLHEPGGLRARLLDHAVEILHLLVRQVELLGPADRLHRAEHAGQRSLEIVRHGVQQGVLHVVLIPQIVRDLGLADQATTLIEHRRLERIHEPDDRRQHDEPHDRVPGVHEHAVPIDRIREPRGQRGHARQSEPPGATPRPRGEHDRHQIEGRERHPGPVRWSMIPTTITKAMLSPIPSGPGATPMNRSRGVIAWALPSCPPFVAISRNVGVAAGYLEFGSPGGSVDVRDRLPGSRAAPGKPCPGG